MKQYGVLIVVALALGVAALFFYFNDPDAPPKPAVTSEAPLQSGAENTAQSTAEQPTSGTQSTASVSSDATTAGNTSAGASDMASASQGTSEAATSGSTATALPPVKPSFDIVRVERDGATVIAGRGDLGADIEVVDEKGNIVARATTNERGEFVALPEQPLGPGEHRLTLRSRASEASPWTESEQSVVIVVPGSNQVAGADGSTLPADGGDQTAALAQPLAVLVPGTEGSVPRVLQGNVGEGISAGDLALEIIDYDADGNLVVGGQAPADARLLIYLDNKAVGDTRAGQDRRWQFSPAERVATGTHQLRVDQIDGAGKVVARVETPFYRAGGQGPLTGEGIAVVQPGNSLWRLARRAYGEGMRYTLILEANKDQIRNPDLIYPGQVFMIPEGQGVQ
ncbi:LysM peptidoglycan-binding domain-containing protein [Limibacillus halophilus]|uniref:Nucleoid-associated protein YgaU n=1 Tax=Limibacillus halophilus TaxID=1579333 RepID=A0A839SQW3_9PROT|nr:LysM peptidoglycan-binding domain-containing protein [Limibacillus halophilus]MBB3064658.1 nucleoid-associated protein YgaU [Limibacillus halophilus]